ncbi:hypothetical protein T484DRAFT_1819120 [Baffinella frigidus]|nr:hypothetical protein T484DRAFT_1819120 [Cryptophyta sp. CCMP2293]
MFRSPYRDPDDDEEKQEPSPLILALKALARLNCDPDDDEEKKELSPLILALKALDRVLSLNPANGKALLRRSEVHQRMRELPSAIHDAEQAGVVDGGVKGASQRRVTALRALVRDQVTPSP